MFEVKVGQEIAYGKFHWSSLISHGSSTVTKINKYGHILLANGRTFDKHGRSRDQYNNVSLIEIRRYHAELAAVETSRNRLRLAQEIETLVHENRTWKFDDELKARLQDMIARL